MKWSNVNLIFSREMRDQMRDRRTLFTVVVLPLVLYPLIGMALLQVAQFMREYPTKVWVVGSENLPQEMPLIRGDQIADDWVEPKERDLIQLFRSQAEDEQLRDLVAQFHEDNVDETATMVVDRVIREQMQQRGFDLAMFIPEPIDRASLNNESAGTPSIQFFVNSANDKSVMAQDRFNRVIRKWQSALVAGQLEENNISTSVVLPPFQIRNADVAERSDKQAAVWSKILPFIVMIWSLTGAFYPAVDLCAGEKERGTFETLLSSPAQRSEIAIGKLMTVMLFSIVTSLLNLLSMGFTGMFVFSRLGATGIAAGAGMGMGPPPFQAIAWLMLALIPISALFSAMALAAAAFARSSKEGQYYLIPLMMISMPLMMLPMLPGAKLEMGSSLIPVTGLMLLLRGLIEGQYSEVAQYAGPVVAVTLVCCWFSIRWVVRQFNSETVLFRASERFGVGAWMRQVMHQRHELPSIGNALLCAMVILVVKFFVSFGMSPPTGWGHFAKQTVIMLVATVGVPVLLMAIILTRNCGKSLRLNSCRIPVACAAILAAICLHPIMMSLTALVMYIYPPSGDLVAMDTVISQILGDAPGLWAVLLVFAVTPAIVEELAFRGFILSGFQGMSKKWSAVLLSALFFGLAHSILQQSIITFVIGVVIGWIAIRTNSLIPCILYHATHNGVTVLISFAKESVVHRSAILDWMLVSNDGRFQYSLSATILMSIGGLLILFWMLKNAEGRNQNAWPLFSSETANALAQRFSFARTAK